MSRAALRALGRAAVLVVAAASAAAQAGDTAGRLSEPWRWHALGARQPRLGPTFLAPGRDGSLYVMGSEAIGRFDGYRWAVPSEWAALPSEVEHAWYRSTHEVEDGLVVVTGAGVFGMERDGAYRRLDDGDMFYDWSPAAARADGAVIVAVRGVIHEATVAGLRPWIDGPADAGRIVGLAATPGGAIWVSTDAGIHRWVEGSWDRVPLPEGADPDARYSHLRANDEAVLLLGNFTSQPPHGLYWSRDEGLVRLETDELHNMTHGVLTREGAVVLATRDRGLRVREGGRWAEVTLPDAIDAFILALLMLDDGRLVVSEGSGSVAVCNLRSEAWRAVATGAAPGRPPIGNTVSALARSRRGGVWVGGSAGLARWDGEAFVDAPAPGSEAAAMLSEISAIHEDERGHLWVGSARRFRGLCEWDGERWRHVREVPGLSDQHVDSLSPAPDGGFWVVTTGDAYMVSEPSALMRWRDGLWTRHDQDRGGLPPGRCFDVATDLEGAVVVATSDGLFAGSGLDGDRWKAVPAPSPHDGLLTRLMVDAAGELWAASAYRGGGVFVRRGESWREVRDGRDLPISATALTQTTDGRVWCASPSGLFVVQDDEAHQHALAPVANFESALADPGGGLWLGTMGRGLLHHRTVDATPPRTWGLVARRSEDEREHVLSWSGADAWGETPPGLLRYQHRVGNGPWSPTRTGSEAVLRDLPIGTQRVEVRALDSAGNMETEPSSITLSVPLSPWLGPGGAAAVGVSVVLLGLLVVVVMRRRRERREARLALLSSQESERHRLSRELHDNLGQLLTALGLHLERARGSDDDAERREAALQEAMRFCRETQDRVRTVSTLMRPAVLDDHGLGKAAQTAVDAFSKAAGVAVISHIDLRDDEIDEPIAVNVFRILHEALTNVARHAAAGTVHVTLVQEGTRLELTVKDDGRGFEEGELARDAQLGLMGMRERAHLLGGQLTVRSRPGDGTTVQVVFARTGARPVSAPRS